MKNGNMVGRVIGASAAAFSRCRSVSRLSFNAIKPAPPRFHQPSSTSIQLAPAEAPFGTNFLKPHTPPKTAIARPANMSRNPTPTLINLPHPPPPTP